MCKELFLEKYEETKEIFRDSSKFWFILKIPLWSEFTKEKPGNKIWIFPALSPATCFPKFWLSEMVGFACVNHSGRILSSLLLFIYEF